MQKIILTAEDRSVAYELLAAMYLKQPSKESLVAFKRLINELGSAYFGEIVNLDNTITERLENMAASSDYKVELEQEYFNHFYVPSSGNYVPPYESAILNKSLWGNETSHCAQCYSEVGFSPSELNIFEPLKDVNIPDHIGFEIAFLAYLAKGESVAMEEDATKWQTLQWQFLEIHLINWLCQYIEELEKCATPFYIMVAKALRSFIIHDVEELSKIARGEMH